MPAFTVAAVRSQREIGFDRNAKLIVTIALVGLAGVQFFLNLGVHKNHEQH